MTSRSRKGWTEPTLEALGVTVDPDGRFRIPVHGDDGLLRAELRYADDGREPKMLAGRGDIRDLFPAPEHVAGEHLYVCEGEPDAISLHEIGLPAVAYPGTGKRDPGWAARLAHGRAVVVLLADCDRGGRKRARELGAHIAEYAAEVRLLEIAPDRDDGYDVGDLIAEAIEHDPVTGREQVRRLLEGAAAYAPAVAPEPPEPNGEHAAAPAGRMVVLTLASGIRSERMRWLAHQRIPLRGLTVVAGEKGLGKSTWTNSYLPAKVTRGLLEGELQGTPADVLVLSGEDDWRVAVKPRLQVHGADLDRVHRVSVRDEHGEALLTLPDDVPQLEQRIVELRDAGRPVALLVIDPIGAFISATENSHADAPVRRILAPLAQLAERQDVAVLIVGHLSKDESRRLLMRVSGSGAFVNAARSVLGFVRDPDDPDGEQGLRRLIVHVSSNWGRYAPTLAVHLEGREVETDDGERDEIGYMILDGETTTTLDDVQRGRDEDGDDAEEAIAEALADGPRPSRDVKKQVTAELKCSRKTVERAAVRMHERGELVIEASGFPRTTTWTLTVETPTVATFPGAWSVATGVNGSTGPEADDPEPQSPQLRHGSGPSRARAREDAEPPPRPAIFDDDEDEP